MGIGGVPQVKMKLLYTSKPENKGGWGLTFFSFIFILMVGILVYEECLFMGGLENFFDYTVFLVICIIIMILLSYLLNEAFWQIIGVEICEYDCNGVKITKKSILKKTKYIRWNEISNVSEVTIHPIWRIITHFTLSGVSQNKIAIHYKQRKIFKCGANLSKEQIRKVIEVAHIMIEEQRMK